MATAYVRSANPIWFMVDLVGQPLDDTYYAFFLDNDNNLVFQDIYQDNQGTTPWANPLQFLANGTLPDNLYFNDSQCYRIEIRQGPTQFDPLIYEIDDYQPGSDGGEGAVTTEGFTDNQISNSQFSQIDIPSPLIIDTAGEYPIAPGWTLVLEGAALTTSTTVTQLALIANQDQINNPPFALRLNNTDWDNVYLRQRLNNNGAIWSSNNGYDGLVSTNFTAKSNSADTAVTVLYQPSNGTQTILLSDLVLGGGYQDFVDSVIIPLSDNTDSNSVGYVDIIIQLDPNSFIDLSNIQVVAKSVPIGTAAPSPENSPVYQQETIERQIDHLFHYYKDPLINKRIPSYLVGWDFPLNPAQFLGDSVAAQAVGTNKSYYAWDQTILFQSANSAITTSRGTGGELVLTAAVDTQMAVIQYLEFYQANKILNDKIAVNLSAYAEGQDVTVTISLWYTTAANLPSISASNNSIVATLDADGHPVSQNGTWTEVPNEIIQQNITFTVTSGTDFSEYSFHGWNLDNHAAADSATFFAIVIGTSSITAANALRIESVGLMSGDIATKPAPQTPDQVLQECQYYYEKSYGTGFLPGVATTTIGALIIPDPDVYFSGGTYFIAPIPFSIVYKNIKRATPNVVLYSPSSITANRVRVDFWRLAPATPSGSINAVGVAPEASPNWIVLTNGTAGIYYIKATTQVLTVAGAVSDSYSANLFFHYTADARLGIVN